ncbi:LytR C-terminal domain-containing protein [Actinomycetes bacterium M1A6_2h]
MTQPAPDSSGPPLRALAMVLISLAIVFATLGFFSLTGAGTEETPAAASAITTSAPAAASAAPNSSAGSAAPTTSASTTTSGSSSAPSVRVLNNSNVSGLAATTASTLEAAGFTVGETGNYSDGTIPTTTVYYDESSAQERTEAQRIATTLGVSAEPRFAGIADSTPGIIVIVTQ